MDWEQLTFNDNLDYFDLISLHIKENVIKDSIYTCDCGRFKNKECDFSGTLCPLCDYTKTSSNPSIDKLTTLIQNMECDIEKLRLGGNIFVKPSPLKMNKNENSPYKEKSKINITSPLKVRNCLSSQNYETTNYNKENLQPLSHPIKLINKMIQTDFSFNVHDEVSFVIKRQYEMVDKGVGDVDENTKRTRKVENEDGIFKEENWNSNDVFEDEQNKTKNHSMSINSPRNLQSQVTKSQEEYVETEIIESSVDALCPNRKTTSSPLLFSQETKDVSMEQKNNASESNNSSDIDECIDGTPPHEGSIFTYPAKIDKTNVSKPVEMIDSDDENNDIESMNTKNHFNKSVNKNVANTTQYNESKENLNITVNSKSDDSMLKNVFDSEEEELKPTEFNISKPKDSLIQNNGASSEDEVNVKKPLSEKKIEKQAYVLNENVKDSDINEYLTQNTQKLSKYNLKIVASNIEENDCDDFQEFIDIFNPMIESDVNVNTNFLLVGVDDSNKVLRRTPKFLKAISLHVCIVNMEFIKLCNKAKDIVTLENHFIPLDSSGLDGPIRSFVNQNVNLLENFVFYNMEKDETLASILESLILSNGGLLINDINLFKIYKNNPQQRKVILYGDDDEASITETIKLNMFTCFNANMLNFKCLFNCVASYNTVEMKLA